MRVRGRYPYLWELKKILISAGITQTELSKRTGINDTKLSRIINGQWLTTREERSKIARALHVPVKEIWPKENE